MYIYYVIFFSKNILCFKIIVRFIASKRLRVNNARYNAFVGFTSGMGYSYLSSSQRFMGIHENSYEVKKYGPAPKETMDEFKRHMAEPNLELIEAVRFKRP